MIPDIPTTLGYVRALLEAFGIAGLITIHVGIVLVFSTAAFLIRILR